MDPLFATVPASRKERLTDHSKRGSCKNDTKLETRVIIEQECWSGSFAGLESCKSTSVWISKLKLQSDIGNVIDGISLSKFMHMTNNVG